MPNPNLPVQSTASAEVGEVSVGNGLEAEKKSNSNRVIVAAFIGTMIEWYDFFLYGTAAALVFNQLFFPTFDRFAGTMASFATYAVGFFARPLGGMVFGHFGDRIGRKSMLIISLVAMGISTFFIGLLPTYEQIGIFAPILLVLLRIFQGLAIGGEWGGAVLMTVEHSDRKRRGFAASWPQAGSPAGLILGTAVFAIFAARPEDEFLRWGWRVPFLFGIVLTVVGLFIRLRISESPVFNQLKKEGQDAKWPVWEALRNDWRQVLIAIGARIAENASFYVFTVFLLTYATRTLQLERAMILNAVLIAAACEFITIPLFGALSDRWGRRPVYLFGAGFLAIFAFPFFWLVNTREPLLIYIGLIWMLACGHAAMYGPQAAFFSELFSTKVRFSGASLGAQFSAPLAGGLAPLICTALLEAGDGDPSLVSVYLAACAFITGISVFLARETREKTL